LRYFDLWATVNAREQFAPAAAHLDAARRCAEDAKVAPMVRR